MRKHIPNFITTLRIIILPVFIISLLRMLENPTDYNPAWPISLFVFLVLTDWLDGWLARRYEWITDTGKWLDPLADKFVDFGSWSILIGFILSNNNAGDMTTPALFSYWVLFLILVNLVWVRFVQDSYSQWWYRRHGGQSNIYGKIKFNCDMLGILVGMLSLRIMQIRDGQLHPAMILMIGCLALGALFAHASLMVKQGKRQMPQRSQVATGPSLIEGLARNPQSLD
jgi:CDP-diacylglycerol--glycerol-3-phosphate 3-phosphatidyltransferase